MCFTCRVVLAFLFYMCYTARSVLNSFRGEVVALRWDELQIPVLHVLHGCSTCVIQSFYLCYTAFVYVLYSVLYVLYGEVSFNQLRERGDRTPVRPAADSCVICVTRLLYVLYGCFTCAIRFLYVLYGFLICVIFCFICVIRRGQL